MSDLTDTAEAELLNHWVRSATMAQINWFVGLFSVKPTDDATGGTEVAYTNYARQPYNPGAANWGFSADHSLYSSLNDVDFPASGAAGDTAVAAGLFDAVTGGTLYASANLVSNRAIPPNSGAVIKLEAGNLRCSLAALQSVALRQRVGGLLFGTGWAKDAAYFAHLWTAIPNADGLGGTRVAGAGYAAATIPVGDTEWTVPSAAGETSNANIIAFPAPGASWGTPSAWTMETDAAGTGDIVGIYDIPVAQRVAVPSGTAVMRWLPGVATATLG